MEKVDVTKFTYKENLAYLYGVSITKEMYEKFLDELLDELINTDPEELMIHINQLRETRSQVHQDLSQSKT